MVLLLLAAAAMVFGTLQVSRGDALSNMPVIQSGVSGACLDLRHNAGDPAIVQIWKCNNSAAQRWSVAAFQIRHGDVQCLSVVDSSTKPDSPVSLTRCGSDPGQVWLAEQGGYRNPHSGQCLNVPDNGAFGTQLTVANCQNLRKPSGNWTPVVIRGKNTQHVAVTCDGLEKRAKLACYAAKEWTIWQSPSADHSALLRAYTAGAPYEAWCADFISYVYKEAGFPFTQGETNGWNENDANKMVNMGFAQHNPDSYIPQSGDIAYFDYNGGHVELVVSGGKAPTFIYGNSGTTDPATGNGQMAANTVTSDGSNGKLVYYLSPL
ncbi:MAG TPA: RICIN domain-containing protein [Candidatus Saccharimonadales bacterium]